MLLPAKLHPELADNPTGEEINARAAKNFAICIFDQCKMIT